MNRAEQGMSVLPIRIERGQSPSESASLAVKELSEEQAAALALIALANANVRGEEDLQRMYEAGLLKALRVEPVELDLTKKKRGRDESEATNTSAFPELKVAKLNTKNKKPGRPAAGPDPLIITHAPKDLLNSIVEYLKGSGVTKEKLSSEILQKYLDEFKKYYKDSRVLEFRGTFEEMEVRSITKNNASREKNNVKSLGDLLVIIKCTIKAKIWKMESADV